MHCKKKLQKKNQNPVQELAHFTRSTNIETRSFLRKSKGRKMLKPWL